MTSQFQERINAWCVHQRELLKAEEQSADLRGAQKKGIVGDVEAMETALGGKVMITIRFESKLYRSIAEEYRSGDAVNATTTATAESNNLFVPAVIVSTGAQYVILSADDTKWPMDWISVRVTCIGNHIVFRRIHKALDLLPLRSIDNPLALAVFGDRESFSPFLEKGEEMPITFMSPSMNASQQQAVRCACTTASLHLIHGPPGTGKTTTLCEILRQLILVQKKRVLVTAPSNVAVDNILSKLMNTNGQEGEITKGIRPLRIGDIARVHESVARFSLEEMLRTSSDAFELVCDVKKEIDKALKEIRNRRQRYDEVRLLRAELRTREAQALRELLRESNLVASTINGASHYMLEKEVFDVVIIDEAAQAMQSESWIACLRAPKVILAGDPCQLPPTVLSSCAELEQTLFEALLKKHPDVCTLLDTQYRMHDDISRWSSEEFYGGKLQSSPCVAEALLSDLPGIKQNCFEARCPLLFVDTCTMGFAESVSTPFDNSRVNYGEAHLVVSYIGKYHRGAGVRLSDIGVITPYAAQSRLIQELLLQQEEDLMNPHQGGGLVEVSTVDSFQGREKLVMIVSFVRCNATGEVGFLSEARRVNVALTRARRALVIIGDSTTLRQKNMFLRRLCDYMDKTAILPEECM